MSIPALDLKTDLFVIDWDQKKILKTFQIPARDDAPIPVRAINFATKAGRRTERNKFGRNILIARPVAYF